MTALRAPSVCLVRGFWLLAAAVLLGNVLALSSQPEWLGTPVPEWPLAIDLLVLLPLLYLLVYRHKGRRAWLGAGALAGLGVLIGSLWLPTESKHLWLWLEPLRYGVLAVIVLAQTLLIIAAISQVRRAARTGNAEQVIDDTLRTRFGPGAVTNLLRLESRLWLYALVRTPVRHGFAGQCFSSHRQGYNAVNQHGFVILAAAEIPIMHGLLHLFFGAVPALVVTLLSAYGLLFLLAEYRATLHRPVSLDDTGVHLRYGVLIDAVVPWHAIVAVDRCTEASPRKPGTLRLRGMGEANVRLSLRPGTRLSPIVGARAIDEIRLGLDDPAGFVTAVDKAITANTEGAATWN